MVTKSIQQMIDGEWAHVCVDMQLLFAEQTDWHAPWLERVLPAIEALVDGRADRTIFTRFIPPQTRDNAHGAWRDYYARWPNMVRDQLEPELLELVHSLKRYVPPARTFDKSIYSPWLSGDLHHFLRASGVETLVVSGGETDVCVLATVLGAIDLGYRVIVPSDAVFGSADATHDGVIELYASRFQTQLSITTVDELLPHLTGPS